MKSVQELTILITGATDGIGRAAARRLAELGARVLIHGRDSKRCADALNEIWSATGNPNLESFVADLGSLEDVRALASEVQSRHSRLDVLINNAGVGANSRDNPGRQLSVDGHELRFAVNYLAPFLLTHLLLPQLRASAPARIVNVASIGQAPLDFDNLMLEREYDGFRAYSQSKLALVMFSFDLAERLKETGITVNALHPGTLLDTKMVREAWGKARGPVSIGEEAEVNLATSPELEGVTGEYFDIKERARANAQAYDVEVRRRLWRLSEELTELG